MRSEGYGSWVCLCVCVSVCLLSHISPLEHLFVLKSMSRIQWATKVKKFVAFSLKPLCCGDPAFPSVVRPAYSAKVRTAWFKKANKGPKATWNTSQCETATALVSVAIFCTSRYT